MNLIDTTPDDTDPIDTDPIDTALVALTAAGIGFEVIDSGEGSADFDVAA